MRKIIIILSLPILFNVIDSKGDLEKQIDLGDNVSKIQMVDSADVTNKDQKEEFEVGKIEGVESGLKVRTWAR